LRRCLFSLSFISRSLALAHTHFFIIVEGKQIIIIVVGYCRFFDSIPKKINVSKKMNERDVSVRELPLIDILFCTHTFLLSLRGFFSGYAPLSDTAIGER
jgi:hypothetical protein